MCTKITSLSSMEKLQPTDIATELFWFIEKRKLEENLIVIGADGTAVNTSPNNGAIRLLQLKIGRPLQWAICKLHLNELSFGICSHSWME